jgi:SMC interacting uncharacterized protein involved in chromosome segregation
MDLTQEIDAIEKKVQNQINSEAVLKVAELETQITQLNNVVAQIEPLAKSLAANMQEAKAIIASLNEKITAMKATVIVEKTVEEPLTEG